MKVRNDFVSNSSSCSFVLIGNLFDRDELMRIGGKLGLVTDENEDDVDIWEILDRIEHDYGFDTHRGLEEYGDDCWCIGLPYEKMKDDETKKEFEKRIADKMNDMISGVNSINLGNVMMYNDAGYN